MNDERRFTEDEVAAIFERATRVEHERERLPGGEATEEPRRAGLTLAEIRRIGSEVGISPEAIEAGARAITHQVRPAAVDRRWLGAPVGVAGSVELPRRLTEDEWAQLVGLIRDRFNAHGKLESAGSLKSWRNGNLRIQLEPTADGERIRMRTVRRSSVQAMTLGSAMLGGGVVLGLMSVAIGNVEVAVSSFGVMSLVGGGFLGASLVGLRGWAAARRTQMEEIGGRAVELASRALPAVDGEPPND